MRTVITHFYNEEYLLPWWLEHHKKLFDHGILIDYASTDRSVEICKKICPDWTVVPSMNKEFGAYDCDREVEYYERQIKGWRIALTVTEFLLGDIDKLTHDRLERTQYLIPEIRLIAWDLSRTLDKNKLLWEQETTGIPYTDEENSASPRSLHNFNDLIYKIMGRHWKPAPHTTEEAVILHYAHCIVGPEMLKRKLQIQTRIPKEQFFWGELGWQHTNYGKGLDVSSAKEMMDKDFSKGVVDCTDLINSFCKR